MVCNVYAMKPGLAYSGINVMKASGHNAGMVAAINDKLKMA